MDVRLQQLKQTIFEQAGVNKELFTQAVQQYKTEYGGSINDIYIDDSTFMQCALTEDNYNGISDMLDVGADHYHPIRYTTSLHVPSTSVIELITSRGKTELLAKFLECGANPHREYHSGSYLIHTAATSGKLKTVQLLLDHGVDPHVVSSKTNSTVIHKAIYSGQISILELFLDLNVNVHINNNRNCDALMYAIDLNRYQMVQLLLMRSYRNINYVNHWYSLISPIHFAKKTRILKLLLEHGANPNVTTRLGITALSNQFHNHITPVDEGIRLLLLFGVNHPSPEKTKEVNAVAKFNFPRLVTLRSLCLRTIYRNRVSIKTTPPGLLFWPDEPAKYTLYKNRVAQYNRTNNNKRKRAKKDDCWFSKRQK